MEDIKKNVSEFGVVDLLGINGVVGDHASFIDVDADELWDFFHVSAEDLLDFIAISATRDIGKELLKNGVVKEDEDFEDIHYLGSRNGCFSHPPSENKIVDKLIKTFEKSRIRGTVFMQLVELFLEHFHEFFVKNAEIFTEP